MSGKHQAERSTLPGCDQRPGVAVGEDPRPGRHQVQSESGHLGAGLLIRVRDRPGLAKGSRWRVLLHHRILSRRGPFVGRERAPGAPAEVDRRRPGRGDGPGGRPHVLAARSRERDAVCASDTE